MSPQRDPLLCGAPGAAARLSNHVAQSQRARRARTKKGDSFWEERLPVPSAPPKAGSGQQDVSRRTLPILTVNGSGRQISKSISARGAQQHPEPSYSTLRAADVDTLPPPSGPCCPLEEAQYWSGGPLSTGFPLPLAYTESRLWSAWPRPRGPPAQPAQLRQQAPTASALAVPTMPLAPPPPPAAGSLQQKLQQNLDNPASGTPPSRSRGTLAMPRPPRAGRQLPKEGRQQRPERAAWPQLEMPEPAAAHAALQRQQQVVYRAAPYAAELARRRSQRGTDAPPRILFLDEGQQCRAVLAEAAMRLLLSRLALPLRVEVASASIGGWVGARMSDERLGRSSTDGLSPSHLNNSTHPPQHLRTLQANLLQAPSLTSAWPGSRARWRCRCHVHVRRAPSTAWTTRRPGTCWS